MEIRKYKLGLRHMKSTLTSFVNTIRTFADPRVLFLSRSRALVPSCTLLCLLLTVAATAQSGTVLETGTDTPLKGAVVSLKSTGDRAVTNDQGKFDFSHSSPVSYRSSVTGLSNVFLKASNLVFSTSAKRTPVSVSAFHLNGKKLFSTSTHFGKGTHSFNICKFFTGSNTCILRVRIGQQVTSFRTVHINGKMVSSSAGKQSVSRNLNKSAQSNAAPDTLQVICYGYDEKQVHITNTDVQNVSITLEKITGEIIPPGMKAIAGGTFMMGSMAGGVNETPVHEVELSPFYIDSTEVTQSDYISLMGVKPWESADFYYVGQEGPRQPVWNINWYDAVLYCNERSKRDGLDTVYTYTSNTGEYGDSSVLSDVVINYEKNGYRLLTEAEWEYACRAGTTTEYFWGDTYEGIADEYAWNRYINDITTQKVATKLPNDWGLYDMCGNVREWINDWYDDYSVDASIVKDPKGVDENSTDLKVMRGGAYNSSASYFRTAKREFGWPNEKSTMEGFRVAKYK